MNREFERIGAIERILARSGAGIRVGIGDDAAVLEPTPLASVLTVDVSVEGVHFRRDLASPSDVGYRAFIAAVSDLAAMGSTPRAALLSWVLPDDFGDEDLSELACGTAEASDATGAPVVGGNLASGVELCLSTTLLGELDGPALLRSGAQPGDGIYVTGEIGSSALGLALLLTGHGDLPEATFFVARWRRPRAALDAGLALRGLASSAIDVSDGLLQDLGHIGERSGVGADLELERIPRHSTFEPTAEILGTDPLELLLAGGEDYELLFTLPPETKAPVGTQIGEITDRANELRVFDASGSLVPMRRRGFGHFGTNRR